jgi:hypothetical protein
MSNESIFVEDENELNQKVAKNLEQDLSNKSQIPYGYLPVKLDSLGKLSAPKILHFRNYSMEEVLELSAIKEENYIEALIKCLNNMVYEKDFDCANLHEKELELVMMSIYNAFWSKQLQGHTYYLDDSIEDLELKNNEKNVAIAVLDISNIQTNTILKEFKEPIKIEIDGKIVKFILPRIKDIILAKEFVHKKYFEIERELSDIKSKIEKKSIDVSYDQNEKFEKMQTSKSLDFLKVFQSSIIHSVNDKVLLSIEDKIKEFPNIELGFWQEYQKVIDEKLNFGINPEVTFFSPELGKKITRRFSFQSMDFIPSLGISGNSRASISFGD